MKRLRVKVTLLKSLSQILPHDIHVRLFATFSATFTSTRIIDGQHCALDLMVVLNRLKKHLNSSPLRMNGCIKRIKSGNTVNIQTHRCNKYFG